MPDIQLDHLYIGFFYVGFMNIFSGYFRIDRNFNPLFSGTKDYYTWKDNDFREFMHYILSELEPFEESRRTILIEELEEFHVISFVHKGTVLVGYEFNKQKRYCLKLKNKAVIGAYGVTFNHRAKFIYTSLNHI